jgi:hypothetical protein
MPMQIQLANKLLWKKLFEGAALLSLAAGYKNRSLLSHPPLIDASPGLQLSFRLAAVLLCSCCIWTEARAERFSINNAISQAVLTNPSIGEASANRRATETELRQTQSTLLPQVRLEARVGPERFTQDITPPPLGNGQWRSEIDCARTRRGLEGRISRVCTVRFTWPTRAQKPRLEHQCACSTRSGYVDDARSRSDDRRSRRADGLLRMRNNAEIRTGITAAAPKYSRHFLRHQRQR